MSTLDPSADDADRPGPTSSRPPRSPDGRSRDRYRERERVARRALDTAASDDERAAALRHYDETYVAGAPIRSRDPEIVRLRRLLTRSAADTRLADIVNAALDNDDDDVT